jgi:endoglucanase
MRLSLTRGTAVLAAAALALTAGVSSAFASPPGPAPATHLYVPPAPAGSYQQIGRLIGQRNVRDAARIAKMVTTPQAVWENGGTPRQVQQDVRRTMLKAGLQHAVPTLVAYNLPYRDCGQYSAGGAAGTTAYEAWIDGLANGIGSQKAIVILEPDGLGLIPNYVSALDRSSNCTIANASSIPAGDAATPANRWAQLNYAVDALEKNPNVSVYLDATHSGWQTVGESADRLVKAGVQRAQGFFLNVSNYQYTTNEVEYGNWVSECVAYATVVSPGNYNGCPNQYWNGGPATSWSGTALSAYKVWTAHWSGAAADLDGTVAGIDSQYASIMGNVQPTAHFVIDTSRNGRGPWDWNAAGYTSAGTAQDWCNPPGRGLGDRPAANPLPSNALLDAYLWVKTPGQSDGQCNRGTTGTTDPEWGNIVDPAAGAWFPQQALQLAQLAQPPLF